MITIEYEGHCSYEESVVGRVCAILGRSIYWVRVKKRQFFVDWAQGDDTYFCIQSLNSISGAKQQGLAANGDACNDLCFVEVSSAPPAPAGREGKKTRDRLLAEAVEQNDSEHAVSLYLTRTTGPCSETGRIFSCPTCQCCGRRGFAVVTQSKLDIATFRSVGNARCGSTSA